MQKKYTSLGLMSGTSGDGVDASILYSDGVNKYEVIKDKYFEYDHHIYQSIHTLKEKIFSIKDIKKFSEELLELERKITLFHAKTIKEFNSYSDDLLIGFHGQTIYHNSKEKISKQLGDGKLLYQLTKKKVIFNFRKNDILNGGEGAPLSPIFHQLIVTQNKIKLPICILNIGGISNITIVKEPVGSLKFFSKDIGPGNCLIDTWVRKNSNFFFDRDGILALSGKKNKIIFEQAQELYANRVDKDKLSFDVNDFDISFARGLSLEDGTTTLTDFTASIIGEQLNKSLLNFDNQIQNIVVCGGGRKNKVLLEKIKKNLETKINIKLIDDYGVDGDFVESQAFAFLAIRSIQKLPISFPNTTGCKEPCFGGELIDC
jgi:anhydro-N-acetylmuramic acid kinase|tara:strand:+ start:499 stop:1620 length:1122 start_codon:yes stop_codon:yes gene_type:complete